MRRLIFLFLCIKIFANPMTYIYPKSETKLDTRYIYEWELLEKALDISKEKYGAYILKPSVELMNGIRKDSELMRSDGLITISLGIGTVEREKKLFPVRIPLDKGLLGYRVFLIKSEIQKELSNINNINGLKKFSIGQQFTWNDIYVWKENGFNVKEGTSYDGLFLMLKEGRFDLFPRGILEVDSEWNTMQNKIDNIRIENSLMIYYPWPRYFFFSDSVKGKKLAERVEYGLTLMINNGSFDKLFYEYNGHIINKISNQKRKIIILKNSLLSKKTPLNNEKLWYKFKSK